MNALEHAVRKTLAHHIGITAPSTIVVAVSAGPDSLALLHLLHALRYPLKLQLIAAYVDHGLRPEETPQEWRCVQENARILALPAEVARVNVAALAAEKKLSLEHAARELRYQSLRTIMRQYGAKRLALGHTADDQAEEILLRLIRGAGGKGLGGMAFCSGDLIRPLLAIPKSRLLTYLHEKNITFCHDSSNDNWHFLRNRIRHQLLPLLEKEYNDGIRASLLKTASNLREDEVLLNQFLEQAWLASVVLSESLEKKPLQALVHRPSFNTLASALQRRVSEKLLYTLCGAAKYEHILLVVAAAQHGRTGSQLHLGGGMRILVQKEQLCFYVLTPTLEQ